MSTIVRITISSVFGFSGRPSSIATSLFSMSEFSYILPPVDQDFGQDEPDIKPIISSDLANVSDISSVALQSLQTFDFLLKSTPQPKYIDPKFQGQHSVWSRFTMHPDCYTCKECEMGNAINLKKFTPPPVR